MNLNDLDFAAKGADGATTERQAALLVHGLTAQDQDWILSQLPERQRARMRELLDELRELGIPEERHWVNTVLASRSGDGRVEGHAQPVQSDVEYFARLPPHSVGQMASLLRTEPEGLVIRVLQLDRWPWQQELLTLLPQPMRGRVVVQLNQQSKATLEGGHLKTALLKELRRQLESHSSDELVDTRTDGHPPMARRAADSHAQVGWMDRLLRRRSSAS
jgi:hypothetical protein